MLEKIISEYKEICRAISRKKSEDPFDGLCIEQYSKCYYSALTFAVKSLLNVFYVNKIDYSELKKIRPELRSGKQGCKQSGQDGYSAMIAANHFSRQDFLYPIICLNKAGIDPPVIMAAYDMLKGKFGRLMKNCRAIPVLRGEDASNLTLQKQFLANLKAVFRGSNAVWQFVYKGRNYTAASIPLEEGLLRIELKAVQKEKFRVKLFPVWIGYSRIIEDEILGELQHGLKGNVKETEKLDGRMLLKAAFFQKKTDIYVHVGNPIALDEFCEAHKNNPEKELCSLIEEELCRLYMPTPVEIFCYALREEFKKEYSEQERLKNECLEDRAPANLFSEALFSKTHDKTTDSVTNDYANNTGFKGTSEFSKFSEFSISQKGVVEEIKAIQKRIFESTIISEKYKSAAVMDAEEIIDEAMPHLFLEKKASKGIVGLLLGAALSTYFVLKKKGSPLQKLKNRDGYARDVIIPEGGHYWLRRPDVVNFYANMLEKHIEKR